MKKAILKISEGLGNQLFMYANAYAFSKKLNYKLFIDNISAYQKLKIRSFLLNHFNININYADNNEIQNSVLKYMSYKLSKKVDILRNKKRFLIEKKNKQKITQYEDYTHKNYSDKVFIEGYFESDKYFKDYKVEINNQFQIKNINNNDLFLDPKTLLNEDSISIAVRQNRYDEKNSSYSNKLKSQQFLKKSIDHIFKVSEFFKSRLSNPNFYVFSNDTNGLKNFFDQDTFTIINHTKNKPINDFYLSTLCKHFIVGPTTFHWWSAYLSKNKNKICIKPSLETNFSSNIDIYPNEWISI